MIKTMLAFAESAAAGGVLLAVEVAAGFTLAQQGTPAELAGNWFSVLATPAAFAVILFWVLTRTQPEREKRFDESLKERDAALRGLTESFRAECQEQRECCKQEQRAILEQHKETMRTVAESMDRRTEQILQHLGGARGNGG